jgi:mycofactocin biosynthetic radical S-adenosylmethionine protein MftC
MAVRLPEWSLGMRRVFQSLSPSQSAQAEFHIRPPDYSEQREGLTLQIWGEEGYWHIIDRETEELLQAVGQPITLKHLLARHPGWNDKVVTRTLQSVRQGLDRIPPQPQKHIENISLNLTTGCNLHCATCYVPAKDRNPKKLDAGKAIEFLDSLGGHLSNTATVSLLGGEPFLHPDCVLAIARWAKQHGHPCNVSTNGTIPLESIHSEIKSTGLHIQVSIDGATAQINDAIRGAGTFEKAMKTARQLIAAGIHTTLCMVACQDNQHEIGDYLRMAKNLGANEARILPLKRLGNSKEGRLTPCSQLEILKIIAAELDRDPSLETLCQSDLYAIVKNMVHDSSRRKTCGSGTQTLLIQADGAVFPCINSAMSSAKFGTIGDSLETILSCGSRWGDALSIDNPNHPCHKCPVKRWCLACCPGETIQREGNLSKRHWNCSDVKNAITFMMWRNSQGDVSQLTERTRI